MEPGVSYPTAHGNHWVLKWFTLQPFIVLSFVGFFLFFSIIFSDMVYLFCPRFISMVTCIDCGDKVSWQHGYVEEFVYCRGSAYQTDQHGQSCHHWVSCCEWSSCHPLQAVEGDHVSICSVCLTVYVYVVCV